MKYPAKRRKDLRYPDILSSRMWYRIDYRDTEYWDNMYMKLVHKRDRVLLPRYKWRELKKLK